MTRGDSHIMAADMVNYGDNDIVLPSFDDDKISWFENTDGLGNFGQNQVIEIDSFTYYHTALEVGDVDNDGDLDIIAASNNDITWYENNGLRKNEINGMVKLDLDIISKYEVFLWYQ